MGAVARLRQTFGALVLLAGVLIVYQVLARRAPYGYATGGWSGAAAAPKGAAAGRGAEALPSAAAAPAASLGAVAFVLTGQSWLSAVDAPSARAERLARRVRGELQDGGVERSRILTLYGLQERCAASGVPFAGAASACGAGGARRWCCRAALGGFWTYLPWIAALKADTSLSTVGWFVFADPTLSAVQPLELARWLEGRDMSRPLFAGRALVDKGLAIVHHYDQSRMAFLDPRGGFVLSRGALDAAALALAQPRTGDVHIDAAYELAKYLRDKVQLNATDATGYGVKARARGTAQGTSAEAAAVQIAVGVTTSHKYHRTRMAIVRRTWLKGGASTFGADADTSVAVLSDRAEAAIAAIDLPSWWAGKQPEAARAAAKAAVGATSGFCDKSLASFHYLRETFASKQWYVLVDDDTLVNLAALERALRRHDPKKRVVLGERYGWGHNVAAAGLNYVSFGGGVALSQAAMQALLACEACVCPSPTSPDDMQLGHWLAELKIVPVDARGFHQASEADYDALELRTGAAARSSGAAEAVTFHRFPLNHDGSPDKAEVQAAWERMRAGASSS